MPFMSSARFLICCANCTFNEREVKTRSRHVTLHYSISRLSPLPFPCSPRVLCLVPRVRCLGFSLSCLFKELSQIPQLSLLRLVHSSGNHPGLVVGPGSVTDVDRSPPLL